MMMMVSAINDSNGTIPLSSASYNSNAPYNGDNNETMSTTNKKKKYGNDINNQTTTTVSKPELSKTTSRSSIINKKRNKPKTNVRFSTDDNVDLLQIDYLYIEHVNELNDEEIQERWFTDEQVEEMDSECKADVYLLENPNSSSSIVIEPRGLEHKTTDGSWNYYTNRKNAANTLLEEIEKQQDEQRFEEEFRLDLEQLAAVYRKVCRIAQKQAYERAYEDYKIARKLYKVDEKSKKKENSSKKKSVPAEHSTVKPSSPDGKVCKEKEVSKAALSIPTMDEKTEIDSTSKVDDDTTVPVINDKTEIEGKSNVADDATSNEETTSLKSKKASVSPKKEKKKSKKIKTTDENARIRADENKNDSSSNGMTVITKRISKKSKKLKDLDEPISTDDEAIPFNEEITAITKKKSKKSITPSEICNKENILPVVAEINDLKKQSNKISHTEKAQGITINDTAITVSLSQTENSPNCQEDKEKSEEDIITPKNNKKSSKITEEDNVTTEVSKESKTKKKKKKKTIDNGESVPTIEATETKKSKKKKKVIESCQVTTDEDDCVPNDPEGETNTKDEVGDQLKVNKTKAKTSMKIKRTKTKVKEESHKNSKESVDTKGESESPSCSLGTFLKEDNKKSKKSSKATSIKDDVSISCSVTTIDFGIMYSKVVRRRRSSKLKGMAPAATKNADTTSDAKCTVASNENRESTKISAILPKEQNQSSVTVDSTSSQLTDVKTSETTSSTKSQTPEPVTKRIQRKVSRMYLPPAPPSSTRSPKAVTMDLMN